MIVSSIQIRFNDIDGFGHVNNAVYWSYFDLGRVDCFTQLFGKDFFSVNETLVLVHVEADYKIQTLLQDTIEVHTSITGIGNKSIKMHQDVVNVATGNIHVVSSSIVSGFNKSLVQSIPIKEEWRENIKKVFPNI
ncbi:MAG: acyl-CoA thioesterase [Bacteroidales bacterium]